MSDAPYSTYRLQFNADFTFDNASNVLQYLHDLGVTHVYASPWLQSGPASAHGYDVADFKSVNQELGGASALERYIQRARSLGIRQILDIVPNHMSLTQNNPYWRDVLENGPFSRFAEYFDIDWLSGEERLRNKILLPILSDQYGIVLENGDIQLNRNGARLELVVDAIRLPVSPSSMSAILGKAANATSSETLSFLADRLAGLNTLWIDDDDQLRKKTQRDDSVLLAMLTRYLSERPDIMSAIDDFVSETNKSSDELDNLLQMQHYRLAHWKAADQDLGYRRFFDVNSLIGVKVERENVFLDTHELILEWLQSGMLDGVRVDHVDGLRDPKLYLDRLRSHAPSAWIVVEKILARTEKLRENWPVAGTSGYDFLNVVGGLFTDPQGISELDAIYTRILGEATDFVALSHDKKIAVTAESLGSDVNRLSSLFLEICESDRNHRDFSRTDIRHALREVAACLSVYRTYVSPERNEVTELDVSAVDASIGIASKYRPDIDIRLFRFIADVLLLRKQGRVESEFVAQFQQFCSPVMAKGVEDSAIYCYNRLIAVNEVGGNPLEPTTTVEEFHKFNQYALEKNPLGMVTLTTHDTKRSEDLRARLFVLSEVPSIFSEVVDRWFTLNAKSHGYGYPDKNTEYLFYQTIIGAWPWSVDRALTYMQKATREAKQQTSWTNVNAQFEQQLQNFIRSVFADEDFLQEVESFVSFIDTAARTNSLAQTLLKCTVPGIPDCYQGSELWDHRLVDPDNRSPVDFNERKQMLAQIQKMTATEIIQNIASGMPKLWTMKTALEVRQKHAKAFGPAGGYKPIAASGKNAGHIIAFLRGDSVVTIVPRLSFSVAGEWVDTKIELPAGEWKNALSNGKKWIGEVPMQQLFHEFPVALMIKGE